MKGGFKIPGSCGSLRAEERCKRGRRPVGRLLAAGCLALSAVMARADGAEPYVAPTTHREAQTINREWTFNYFPEEKADKRVQRDRKGRGTLSDVSDREDSPYGRASPSSSPYPGSSTSHLLLFTSN